ncbi:Hermansky-Pudlak syndrome 4 protein [Synchiropus splendidus]|uniref:Hermansky-Pudlak syndrome 4 protein n=1 Tax=Synchiropus splendidus TaxID=270530 RepID=UPI00237E5461|nr:Hermansky-Pudlak syndrome 4 protein [Synchiropus splendidus]XP_053725732.1 Hermansky-Pudlak syndrome 4 protein [Synchiropus splendidus]
MAEMAPPESRWCSYFLVYDGSLVQGEGDRTREGICYFYPEQTPLDSQELLCGQLAGVCRCVSELSSSPVRVLRLRRNKFAIRMKDDFIWALGCSVDVPTVSVCQLLDQLIDLFCFYNGPVRQSYQLHSRESLAARWAQYLSYLLPGSSELHQIFSCLKTIDYSNVDPLLLLKAALILQACQRCPLVLAGCVLFRGRVVSTQMTPELTMKVMVHESETHDQAATIGDGGTSSCFGDAVSSTPVFLTTQELHYLHSAPVDSKDSRSFPTPHKYTPLKKTRLSRTLSDVASTDSEPSELGGSQSPQSRSSPYLSVFSPGAPQSREEVTPPPQTLPSPASTGKTSRQADESLYFSVQGVEEPDASTPQVGTSAKHEETHGYTDPPDVRAPPSDLQTDQATLVPMTLYLHRVRGLVLALLVEPHFLSDSASMEEVYHSCLASLNGLEAHLRSISPGALAAAAAPYVFAHYDCVQSTLATNMSGRPGGAPERPFVRATSLLHSHFCNSETLQEAIIRSAGAAVYGTRSVAHETFFLQQGAAVRNSGIPNHQDSAFSLPSKARHRLLKHGVSLL